MKNTCVSKNIGLKIEFTASFDAGPTPQVQTELKDGVAKVFNVTTNDVTITVRTMTRRLASMVAFTIAKVFDQEINLNNFINSSAFTHLKSQSNLLHAIKSQLKTNVTFTVSTIITTSVWIECVDGNGCLDPGKPICSENKCVPPATISCQSRVATITTGCSVGCVHNCTTIIASFIKDCKDYNIDESVKRRVDACNDSGDNIDSSIGLKLDFLSVLGVYALLVFS